MAHGIGVPRTHMVTAMASTSASSIPTTIPAMAPPDMPASPSRPPLLPDVASTVSSMPTGVGEAVGKTAGCSLVPVPSPLSPDESSLVGVVPPPVPAGAAMVVLAPPFGVATSGDADGAAVVVEAAGVIGTCTMVWIDRWKLADELELVETICRVAAP